MKYVLFGIWTVTMIFIGWVIAHNTVAKECTTLNSFYVGNTIYECRVKL